MYGAAIGMSKPPPKVGLLPTPTDKKNIHLTAPLKEELPAKTKTATLLNLGDLNLNLHNQRTSLTFTRNMILKCHACTCTQMNDLKRAHGICLQRGKIFSDG